MTFKFEKLETWQCAIEYVDLIYGIAAQLPRSEDFNLKSQITRAATSVALNIAEGSTGMTDLEQARFLGLALRSVLETVACQHIIKRRGYLQDITPLRHAYRSATTLVRMLQSMRKSLVPEQSWLHEDIVEYEVEEGATDDGDW